MNFEFTPQHEQVREAIARFATEEMAPLVAAAEENEVFPRELSANGPSSGCSACAIRKPTAALASTRSATASSARR